jgi:ribonuclease BN (tRNA processing enzyme)
MNITFLGTGDAFGSGGRLQTSLLVEAREYRPLVDCGAS